MTIPSCQQSLSIKKLVIKQLYDRDSCTYTYLLVDPNSHQGAIIDGVKEQLKRDLQYIEELGVELLYAIETHVHADHISSAGLIRQNTGAKIVYNQAAAVKSIDIQLNDGDELTLGQYHIKAISTPGHTSGCMSYYIGGEAIDGETFNGTVFTGDTLLIRGCGRTDFQQAIQQSSTTVLLKSCLAYLMIPLFIQAMITRAIQAQLFPKSSNGIHDWVSKNPC